MVEFFKYLVASEQFMPHGYCYLWQPALVWLHIISDFLIALAYYSIPIILVYFVRKRQDLPFTSIFFLFGTFIVACGTTHVMEIWTLWHPTYWLSGSIKSFTAIVSIYTFFEMVQLVPKALALPSPAQLEAINLELRNQIVKRQKAEEALQKANDELETRVKIRTNELAKANVELQREINERQQIEIEKSESEERFKATFHSAAVGIAHVRMDGRWLLVNQKLCDIVGYTHQELLDRTFQDISHPDDLDIDLEYLRQMLAGEIQTYSMEKRYIRKDSSYVWIYLTVSLVRDSNREPKYFIAIITDITEKKKLEAQFLRTQRLESIGTLASGIAHDLNNVFTPILALTHLFLNTKLSDEKKQKLLTTVEASVKRGAALVKQVLQFARGIESQRTAVQLGRLLEEFQQITFVTFPKSIEICSNISPDIGFVFADATQLQQIFMNLCVNARDAMPDGGVLSISAENIFVDPTFVSMNPDVSVGTYIVVTVSDTGIGISPEIMDRIFEPFFTTKEMGRGTGLGLSTVFGIVKNHGGFIKVYSEVGQGTQFKVYLPAVEGSVSQHMEDIELFTGNGELILFVDDELAIQEISKTLLVTHNYKLLSACDGIEALTLYTQHQQEINVVVMDIMMPSLNGIDTIRSLQKINPLVKIIAISGLESNRKIVETFKQNVQAFLLKPYTIQQLLKTLHSVLSMT
ncbi:PAS domain S-box protein [Scytonema sp. UIC 10036]|uniref:hybrid sensor histidine kinase/response regulator n=1 Tax=Scytonema sp. UIC 10036 TaxID=2304196 RepID=UPI0012DAE9D1|nr:PAS domain-containing sensor histidine kinase [Scytonema sp. UIC 10036]MUG97330.1 PAS domain S-box protein [Scytonema sp. UIC 10036]